MADKKYLNGNGKEVIFSDGNSLINVYIDLDDAKEKGLIFKTKQGRNGLAFTLARKSEPGEYGDTHYLYHKDKGSASAPVKKVTKTVTKPDTGQAKETSPSDDLPF